MALAYGRVLPSSEALGRVASATTAETAAAAAAAAAAAVAASGTTLSVGASRSDRATCTSLLKTDSQAAVDPTEHQWSRHVSPASALEIAQ